jgi:hypothetical protein
MYLKNYDIVKLGEGFRLVNQTEPDDKHDPIDKGLFKPGDTFIVNYNGFLSHTGNAYNEIIAQAKEAKQ